MFQRIVICNNVTNPLGRCHIAAWWKMYLDLGFRQARRLWPPAGWISDRHNYAPHSSSQLQPHRAIYESMKQSLRAANLSIRRCGVAQSRRVLTASASGYLARRREFLHTRFPDHQVSARTIRLVDMMTSVLSTVTAITFCPALEHHALKPAHRLFERRTIEKDYATPVCCVEGLACHIQKETDRPSAVRTYSRNEEDGWHRAANNSSPQRKHAITFIASTASARARRPRVLRQQCHRSRVKVSVLVAATGH